MKSNLLNLILIFILFISVNSVFSQNISVSGVVTSADDGETLPGVTIQVKGTQRGTTTNMDGFYSIEAKVDEILVFRFMGFESQEVQIKQQTTLNIALKSDSKQLEGVVVTALGIKRQKRELGYATEKVDGEVLERSGSSNIISSLSGRSAGVQIINPMGVDGGTSRIVIRGNNSITGDNQPLIVVDGVPMSNEGGITGWGGGRDWGTALNNINKEDIEDVNILKGPTAAALYGSRGGNGVVLITTKRGSKQKGLGITYSTSYKITTPYLYRSVQNKYGAGGPLSFDKPKLQTNQDGVYVYPGIYGSNDGPAGEPTNTTFGYYASSVSWGPEMDGTEVLWWDGVMRPYSPQPNNIRMLYKNAHMMTNSIAFSNGGNFGSLRVSITDSRSNAIIDNTKLRQTTFNVGSLLNISEKIKADIALTYLDYYRLNSPEIGESYTNFSKGLLYGWPRSWKGLEYNMFENEDGSMKDWNELGYDTYFPYMDSRTFWMFYNNNTTLNRKKIYGSTKLTYDITDWLMAVGKVAVDFTLDEQVTRNKPTLNDNITDGYYFKSVSPRYTLDADFLITAYKKNIFGSLFHTSISLGGETLYKNNSSVWGSSGKWVYPNLYSFNNYESKQQVPGESKYEKQVNSLYAFLNIGYADYLFLDITGRNDWSSTLPAKNNSYFYPSFTLSFIPTEAFSAWRWGPVSFLKIRGSFAMTAIDDDPYKLDFVYNTGAFGNMTTAYLPNLVPPLELKPQRQRSYETGLNMTLFDKLDIDFTYYYIYAWDQIFDAPLANSSGASSVRTNSGIVTNSGIESIINYRIVEKKDLYAQVGLNFARNRNKVVSLGGADMYVLSEMWGSNGPAIAVKEGEYYGTIYGWDYVYTYKDEQGNTVGPFYDDNGNALPILNDDGTEYLITPTRVAVGNASPWLTAGINFSIGWKNFMLSGLIDSKLGGDIYCGSYVIGMQSGQSPETLYERDGNGLPYYDENGNFIGNYGVVLNGVHKDGTVNDKVVHYYYKYMPNYGGWGNYITTPGIVKNTWVKMRELSLTYTFPQQMLEKQKVFQRLQLSVVCNDLFYFYRSLPDRINPEGTIGSGNAQGLEYGSYPGTRSFMFTIKAGF